MEKFGHACQQSVLIHILGLVYLFKSFKKGYGIASTVEISSSECQMRHRWTGLRTSLQVRRSVKYMANGHVTDMVTFDGDGKVKVDGPTHSFGVAWSSRKNLISLFFMSFSVPQSSRLNFTSLSRILCSIFLSYMAILFLEWLCWWSLIGNDDTKRGSLLRFMAVVELYS